MTWFEFYFLTKTAGFSSFSSIEELAAHLDVSPSTIRRWCKTDRPPKAFFYLNLLAVDFSHLGRQWKYWKVNPRIGKLSNGRHDYYPDQLHSILHLENVIECQRREIEQLKHGYQFDLFGDSPPSSEE